MGPNGQPLQHHHSEHISHSPPIHQNSIKNSKSYSLWNRQIFSLAGIAMSMILLASSPTVTSGMLADRSRMVKHRQNKGASRRYQDNGKHIEGQNYRLTRLDKTKSAADDIMNNRPKEYPRESSSTYTDRMRQTSSLRENKRLSSENENEINEDPTAFRRKLASQLTGCCYTYEGYSASDMCGYYGQDCDGDGGGGSKDNDEGCSQDGLSFVGISFSVNTASGNPYSYQLCDQFPMENIIDRDYDYVMSMDEDGWLVGGGYKPFDYSGKMP